VRASAVLAVQPYTDGDRFDGAGAGSFAGVVVAGGSDDPVWWRSPHTPARLRAAFRVAEHEERLRHLEVLARVAAASRREAAGDG
jgi:hypothetical protein